MGSKDRTAPERQALYRARRDGDDDALTEYVTSRLTVTIRRELQKCPPLRDEQRARLAALFQPTGCAS